MIRLFHGALALIALFLLPGCAIQEIGLNTSFNAKSNDSIVIAGVRANSNSMSWEYLTRWQLIDPQTGTFNLKNEFIVFGLSNIFGETDTSKRRYVILRAHSGQYGLVSSAFHKGKHTRVVINRPQTVAFKVAVGEIAYIGEYLYSIPKQGFFPTYKGVNLKFVGRDDRAARIALDKYKGVVGEINFVKPEPFTLK